jgi:hypothetical protein
VGDVELKGLADVSVAAVARGCRLPKAGPTLRGGIGALHGGVLRSGRRRDCRGGMHHDADRPEVAHEVEAAAAIAHSKRPAREGTKVDCHQLPEVTKVDCLQCLARGKTKIDCLQSSLREGTKVDCLQSQVHEGTIVDCLQSPSREGAKVDCLQSQCPPSWSPKYASSSRDLKDAKSHGLVPAHKGTLTVTRSPKFAPSGRDLKDALFVGPLMLQMQTL